MVMNVEDFLTAFFAAVVDQAKALQRKLFRQLLGDEVNMADQRQIFGLHIHERRDGFARDDEQMHRRFGGDVMNDDDLLVLILYASRNLALHDSRKDAFFHFSITFRLCFQSLM